MTSKPPNSSLQPQTHTTGNISFQDITEPLIAYNQGFYDKLREEIRTMGRKSPIYKILKEELTKKGHWKNRPRGDALKGGIARKRQREQENGCLGVAKRKANDW